MATIRYKMGHLDLNGGKQSVLTYNRSLAVVVFWRDFDMFREVGADRVFDPCVGLGPAINLPA
jgi:hypothetical protein